MGRKLIGHRRPVADCREHIAAYDVDLVGQRDHYRITGVGRSHIDAGGNNRIDPGDLARRQNDNLFAFPRATTHYRARKAAE